jgi:DNA-binding transcriptional ArsR family regulator
VDAFEAIADPVRRDLLMRLSAGPARVVDLAAAHPISRPAVSRHLRVLTAAGLVDGEERGRERHYRLLPRGLAPVHQLLAALSSVRIGDDVLDALELEVRRTRRDRSAHDTTQEEAG